MATSRDVPPFPPHHQLIVDEPQNTNSLPHTQEIPNEPLLSTSKPLIKNFLQQELETAVLDQLYPYLWLVAKKDSSHIDALHQHIVKGRRTIAAEDPALHLVWHEDIIYVKPLPHCLLNYSFWEHYLLADIDHRLSAQGLLRSYSYLIQHESDFFLAQNANLIPTSTSYRAFQTFIRPFKVLDNQVAKRYHYGQLRLTRLNIAVRFVRPSTSRGRLTWYYQRPHWHSTAFFGSFGPPLLFTFASFSLILSAMQVVLAALGLNSWQTFTVVSWGFSIAVVVLVAILGVAAVISVLVLVSVQRQFAIRAKLRERVQNNKDEP